MKRIALFALATVSMILAACGSPLTSPALIGPDLPPNFNRGFVTTDETVQFYSGMAQSTVLSICGNPLYVAYGDRERVIWVYEVRELLVGSGSRSTIAKTSDVTTFGEPLHYLAVSFQGGTLQTWGTTSIGQLFDGKIFSGLLPEQAEEATEIPIL